MTIQWFPGHMAKAIREMQENLKRVDVVIELADARIPESSRNPKVQEAVGEHPKVIVLMKADMADSTVTKRWKHYYESHGETVVLIDAKKNHGIQKLMKAVTAQAAPKMEALKKKGIRKRSIRAMIVGIPNVGKSTLINRLVGKNQAKTGNTPGVTRKNEWLKVGNEMELLDTPGILWPKFDDITVGYKLAATGAIKDERLDFQDVALFVVEFLKAQYPAVIEARYNIEQLPDESLAVFEEIGRKRGCLIRGGEVDFDQAAEIILREFRAMKLGKLSLEQPSE